jgi:hypothetical protein
MRTVRHPVRGHGRRVTIAFLCASAASASRPYWCAISQRSVARVHSRMSCRRRRVSAGLPLLATRRATSASSLCHAALVAPRSSWISADAAEQFHRSLSSKETPQAACGEGSCENGPHRRLRPPSEASKPATSPRPVCQGWWLRSRPRPFGVPRTSRSERRADLPDTSVSTRSSWPTGWHYPDPGIGVLARRSLPRLLAPRFL